MVFSILRFFLLNLKHSFAIIFIPAQEGVCLQIEESQPIKYKFDYIGKIAISLILNKIDKCLYTFHLRVVKFTHYAAIKKLLR